MPQSHGQPGIRTRVIVELTYRRLQVLEGVDAAMKRLLLGCSVLLLFVLLTIAASGTLLSRQRGNPAARIEDHQNMMAQLGIRKLRPGPSGNESDPNHANYDEAAANP